MVCPRGGRAACRFTSLVFSFVLGAVRAGAYGMPVHSVDAATTVSKWSRYELPLTATKTYGNPYTDITVTATFTGPGGVSKKVTGFWDGGHSFKVRFTPTQQGTWAYAIASDPSDAGLTTSGSSTAGASSSGNHGFVRRDFASPTVLSTMTAHSTL
jgi:hypothetical protein